MTQQDDATDDILIHQQSFTVRIHEVNGDRQLTIPALLRLLQEASMQHIIKLKASVWDLEEQNISWVLLRKQLNILKPTAMGERLTVITYPTGFDKFFAYRDYLVFSASKELIATAATTWSLIDVQSRKLTKVPDELMHLVAPEHIKRLRRADSKMPRPAALLEAGQKEIMHYDLDWNGHVNNVVLCTTMMEHLLAGGKKESEMGAYRFIFKNESRLGDELTIYTDDTYSYAEVVRGDKVISKLITGPKISSSQSADEG